MRLRIVRSRRFSAAGSALLLLGVVAGVAMAHARLVRSTPAADEHVDRPPAELRLEFSEAVTARTSRIELVAPDSQRHPLALRGDSTNARLLIAAVPALPATGTYRVDWRLVGPDGHPVTGRYAFTIDSIPAPPPPPQDTSTATPAPEDVPESGDSILQRSIRFLSALGMMLILGAVAFRLFVLPASGRAAASGDAFRMAVEARLRWLAATGAWLLLGLAAVRLTSHAVLLSGSFGALRASDFGDVLIASTFGRGWLLQVVAIIVLLTRLQAKPSVNWSALAWISMALAISAPFLGHPAAVADIPLFAMGLDAVHVVAAGGWAGGILMFAVAALPKAGAVAEGDRTGVVRDLLRAFTPLALACAAILAVTGALAGWIQIRDLGLVLQSEYGVALIRKVVVVAIIAAAGAYHWRVAQPSIAADRSLNKLRVSLGFDVVLVLAVLVLTAILTGTAPPVR